jgi:SnoaL-like domain
VPTTFSSARLTVAGLALTLLAATAWSRTPATPTPAHLSALNEQAQTLEDINAVKKLQRAYGDYLDRGFWGQAADLFADNATLEWGEDGVQAGKARIRDYLVRQGGGRPGPGLPYGQYNHHLQLQPVIHIDKDGHTAHGRWRELALTGHYKVSAEWGAGIYENSYSKENGVWKIQSLHFYPTFVAPYAGGWAKLSASPKAKYPTFPSIFVPPFHYEAVQSVSSPAVTGNTEADRLAILRSREEIENLQSAYGYYTDKGLWSKASQLFAPNGTYEYGQHGVYVGVAHIRAALALTAPEGLSPGILNDYMMLQPIIDVAPDNKTAKARWRSDVMLSKDGRGQWGEGTYENTYVNLRGAWKIQSIHFYPTVFFDYDLGWAKGPVAMDGPSTVLPPDRPPTERYQSFPSAYLPPYHYSHPVMDARPPSDPPPSNDPAVNELRRRVTLLEDKAAVERLQRAYGYYVDKLQWAKVADLFASDATLEIGGRGVFVGKAHVLAYLQGLGETGPQTGLVMNHQQLQGIVDVAADGTSAAGRWTAFIMAGKAPDANWGDATYENRYVKEGGVWKIKALHAPFQMYSPVTEGWGRNALPNTRPDSWDPPPDLPSTVTYNSYPSFYVEPYHYANPVTGERMPALNPAAGGVAEMTSVRAGK